MHTTRHVMRLRLLPSRIFLQEDYPPIRIVLQVHPGHSDDPLYAVICHQPLR